MKAVLATLRWLQANEQTVRAAVAKSKLTLLSPAIRPPLN
jgi:hypothetical protein